jgi:hypothetical protein
VYNKNSFMLPYGIMASCKQGKEEEDASMIICFGSANSRSASQSERA